MSEGEPSDLEETTLDEEPLKKSKNSKVNEKVTADQDDQEDGSTSKKDKDPSGPGKKTKKKKRKGWARLR